MEPTIQNQPPMQNQPTPPPVKRRLPKKLLTVVGAFLLVFGVLMYMFIQDEAQRANQQGVTGAPDNNTFYAGVYENTPVLFYRSEAIHESGIPANPFLGNFVAYEEPIAQQAHNTEHIDFRKVTTQKKLFTFERYAHVDSLKLSDDKSWMMLSLTGGEKDNENTIYQINLKTSQTKTVWEHELGSGERPYSVGTARILAFVPDAYLAYEMIRGQAPPIGESAGVVVRNIKSGNEKVLGTVGDVAIDEENKTVSFSRMQMAQVPCEGGNDPVCFAKDTYKMGLKAVGAAVSEPLP